MHRARALEMTMVTASKPGRERVVYIIRARTHYDLP
jgi:hypothetical protein